MSRPLLQSGPFVNRVGDIAILVLASFVAAYDHEQLHWKVAAVMALAAVSLWMLCSSVLRHYDVVLNGRGFLGDIALTVVLLVAVVTPMWFLRAVSTRYAVTTQLSTFLLVLLPAVLWLRLRVVGLRLLNLRPLAQVLVVGVGPLARYTHQGIQDGSVKRSMIGYLRFDGEGEHTHLGSPLLGAAADLERVLRDTIVDEVYFAASSRSLHASVQEGIGICERFGIPFAVPACDYRMARARPACAKAISDGYVHCLSVRHSPIQRVLKRSLDIAVSFAALFVLSPVLLATAFAVKLTSRGPIFFRQERVGLHGRTFSMLKFRSMVSNAEALKAQLALLNEQGGPIFKMKRDPRVTAVGRFIRKHSIDELPQLVNVLRGDMSLVGPRPPLPSETAKYETWQRRRLSVRPGLTCVWQVSGRSQISFDQWMLLDMRYIDHWSLLEDIRLIMRTVPVVLTGRGAS
jgi:exopolysaccharide biosynthesis polyprenyl glycosylphosphotransferase